MRTARFALACAALTILMGGVANAQDLGAYMIGDWSYEIIAVVQSDADGPLPDSVNYRSELTFNSDGTGSERADGAVAEFTWRVFDATSIEFAAGSDTIRAWLTQATSDHVFVVLWSVADPSMHIFARYVRIR